MYKQIGRIRVHAALLNAVEADILPGTGLSAAAFWKSLDDVLHEFGGRNAALLRKRDGELGFFAVVLLLHTYMHACVDCLDRLDRLHGLGGSMTVRRNACSGLTSRWDKII